MVNGKSSKIKEETKINEEAELLKSQLARTLADYDNLVKRVEREREELGKMVSLRLVLKLLTVLDGLESAQKHLQDQGLAISIVEFKKVLSEEDLIEVNPKIGDSFNENEMEAIEVVDSEGNNNTIAEVTLVGWKYLDGSVVRHAKVKVIKK
jgi:molecular chaperone GrpE